MEYGLVPLLIIDCYGDQPAQLCQNICGRGLFLLLVHRDSDRYVGIPIYLYKGIRGIPAKKYVTDIVMVCLCW